MPPDSVSRETLPCVEAPVLARARRLVGERLGLHLTGHRDSDLEDALARASAGSPSLESYLERLAASSADEPEWRRLAATLTVGETFFFRDQAVFEALAAHVLPELIASRRARGVRRLRLWSAGCATGEEPYSLAILVDQLLPDRSDWAITVLATDVNAAALERAAGAVYREWSLRTTPEPVRRRYFERSGADYRLDPELARMVSFVPLNLAEPCYPNPLTDTTGMDVVLCRNVLMYFTPAAQDAVAERLARSLAEDGWLAVAAVEAASPLTTGLVPVAFPGAVFHRRRHGGRSADPEAMPQAPGPPLAARTMPPPHPAAAAPPRPLRRSPEPAASPDPSERPGLSEARRLADQGLLDEARRACEDAVRSDRLDAEAYLLLAAIAQEQGQPAEALEALGRASYLAPDDPAVHFLTGVLRWRLGDRSRGRRSLDAAVRLLDGLPPDRPLERGGGLTAARLRAAAQAYLEQG